MLQALLRKECLNEFRVRPCILQYDIIMCNASIPVNKYMLHMYIYIYINILSIHIHLIISMQHQHSAVTCQVQRLSLVKSHAFSRKPSSVVEPVAPAGPAAVVEVQTLSPWFLRNIDFLLILYRCPTVRACFFTKASMLQLS